MTLSNSIFEESLPATSNTQNVSINLDSLYCTHLWSNSCLRNAIITASFKESRMIKYCYTCKGKIRKYDLSPVNNFLPINHSTPNRILTSNHVELASYEMQESLPHEDSNMGLNTITVDEDNNVDNEYIPTISRKLDSSFRHKFVSHEIHSNQSNSQRLRKSPKGLGCIVNFALTESPLNKWKQIQACSISIMIIAIIIISFILVNFTTPNYIHATNANNTTVVPTKFLINRTSSSAITSVYTELPPTLLVNTTVSEPETTTEYVSSLTAENVTEKVSSVFSKIRKNIRTYSRYRNHSSPKPKDIINRDISQRFCSCQRNEICMLDENSGTSLCRIAIDNDDPTGCGGLCALETEACQLVDKARGVRVCRLLSAVTCAADEWRCRNGLCVPAEARCDGIVHCYDRTDEMHCDCDLTKQFRCGHSISCFPNSKLCDSVIDCWDGYDEVNCTAECPKEQFTCTDGQCISSSRFCDGFADCGDGSDEPDGCGVCGPHEVQCANQRCVPRGALCDGTDDCGDASDETQCQRKSLFS